MAVEDGCVWIVNRLAVVGLTTTLPEVAPGRLAHAKSIVMVFATVLGIASAFDIPTRQSFVVELVGKDDLMNGIALNSSAFNAARVVGPAVAGALIGLVGIAWSQRRRRRSRRRKAGSEWPDDRPPQR